MKSPVTCEGNSQYSSSLLVEVLQQYRSWYSYHLHFVLVMRIILYALPFLE